MVTHSMASRIEKVTMTQSRGTWTLIVQLFASGVIAQAFGFFATAYAAVLTNPEDFALFGIITALTAVLASFNTMAAETRLTVLGRLDAEALCRAGLCAAILVSIICLTSGFGLAVSGLGGYRIALFVGAASLMVGLQQLLTGVVLRHEAQSVLARSRIVQGLSNAGFLVVFLHQPMSGYEALSLAWVLSLGLSNLPLLPEAKGWSSGFKVASRSDWRRLGREVRWQPVSNMLAQGVGAMPLILLPAFGANLLAGAWALANRFLMPLVNMVQMTLQPVYYGRAAALLRDGMAHEFSRYHKKWLIGMMCAGAPALLASVICINWLIPLLGDNWKSANLVLVPACLFFSSCVIWLPLSQTLVLRGYVDLQFTWTGVRCLVCLAPFSLGFYGAYESALLLWSVSAVGTAAVHLALQRRGLGAACR